MATEYTCITRKIEVHLHRHGDTEEAKQRLKDEYRIWDEVNDNLYKVANRIVSHCFFNDAYEYRLKLHSPRFQEIERLLRYSKRNKLSDDVRASKPIVQYLKMVIVHYERVSEKTKCDMI